MWMYHLIATYQQLARRNFVQPHHCSRTTAVPTCLDVGYLVFNMATMPPQTVLISAPEFLIPVLFRHRLWFTLNIVTALMVCYAVHFFKGFLFPNPAFSTPVRWSRSFQSHVFSFRAPLVSSIYDRRCAGRRSNREIARFCVNRRVEYHFADNAQLDLFAHGSVTMTRRAW